jgi:polysaccharide pyruvyl transferase WcaK-like protein
MDQLKEKPCNIVMFPFHFSEDKAMIHELCKRSTNQIICIEERHTVNEMFSMIEALDVLVGVRLHALIFSAVSGTPVVGISYDPKIDAFLKAVNESSVCNIDDINVSSVVSQINYSINHRQEKSQLLDEHVAIYKNRLKEYNGNINAMLDVR